MIIGLSVYVVSFINLYKITCKQTPIISSKLICPLQRAFVPNRDIHDIILIAHEILSTLKHSKKWVRGNKLDMEKFMIDWIGILSKCLLI